MSDIVTREKARKFRDTLKQMMIDNQKDFWTAFNQIKNPKDKCEIYIKMMPYCFSRAPEEKDPDDPTKKKLLLERTTERATLIAGGLPEDIEFEEEEETM